MILYKKKREKKGKKEEKTKLGKNLIDGLVNKFIVMNKEIDETTFVFTIVKYICSVFY